MLSDKYDAADSEYAFRSLIDEVASEKSRSKLSELSNTVEVQELLMLKGNFSKLDESIAVQLSHIDR